MRAKRTGPTPLEGVDVVLTDLDGVVYAGPHAIPHAVEALNRASESRRVGYITNNASRSDASVAAHLSELGLNVAPADVVTSPQAAMRLLAEVVPAGSRVLVIGGEGITTELERNGYTATRSADDAPAAVIQGFTPEIGWVHLAEAAFALAPDAEGERIPWIATNTDWTIPVARGIAPGNGTLVAAVHTAVGILPQVAGKPETPIFDVARERFAAENAIMIGDRLDTDILGANRAGIRSVAVLTGIDREKQLLAAKPDERPTFIVRDLRELDEPYPEIERRRDEVRVRGARVKLSGNRVEIVKAGDDATDLLRAACTLIWESGTPIHALIVPESLYL
ncbi:HAD-IIA family hydrolase [Agromyces atrinae]|uniref:HAD-IIA family hydrolase n=1 Tax=Agromyces atrinae TaxID=592376 RepID=UPI001F57B74D|nr:HAD-IIA family hydrolase [Agromyces atrinae]MCI2958368.1 HAD-IIA family hydrolase [Agromyces atrinae]